MMVETAQRAPLETPDRDNHEQPAPMAHQAIHDTVVRILEGLPRGRLLDVPAGMGALAVKLGEAGFDVRCCDLYPEIFRLQNVEIKQGDLDSTLPYDDQSFDYIVCVEGLEHIISPPRALAEFARLIRPVGHLIISVPNILNVEERLKWLVYGYTSHFKPLTREYLAKVHQEFGEKAEIVLHVNPIGYPELRYTLEKNGFEIVRIYRDKPKARLWLYWPIIALIRLIGRLTPARRRRERWLEELQSDEILLGGNTLIVHAIKA